MFKSVLFLGDGAMGTAMSIILAKKGVKSRVWGAFPEYTKVLLEKRENIKYLAGVKIPEEIEFVSDFEGACVGIDLIAISTPTQFIRSVLQRFKPFYKKDIPALSLAKGIEIETFLRPSEIISDVLGNSKVASLSGPSHAEEVARFLPCAVVVASIDEGLAKAVQKTISQESFRAYTSADLIGVELGGALKNIIAIAGGICDGLRLGDNAKSTLITRGLVEIARMGVALGGKRETFNGLSGIGDLITTCISPHGRNRFVGEEIGKGKKLNDILKKAEKVAEGVWTTEAVYNLAKEKNIEMPITAEIYKVLFEDKNPSDAIKDLMKRKLKSEV